jgi:hypothetical protein
LKGWKICNQKSCYWEEIQYNKSKHTILSYKKEVKTQYNVPKNGKLGNKVKIRLHNDVASYKVICDLLYFWLFLL